MTLKITKKAEKKQWPVTYENIAKNCGMRLDHVKEIIQGIRDLSPKNDFDWESMDWKSICEEVSDHPNEESFLDAIEAEAPGATVLIRRARGMGKKGKRDTYSLRSQEERIEDTLRDPCGMADLLRQLYEEKPDKVTASMIRQRALSRPDLLQYVKQGHCGNGRLKHYVNDLMVRSVMTPDEVDDTLKEMEGDVALSGEVERGYIKELSGFRFPKAKRVKELIRLLGDRYKLELVDIPEQGVTLAVFKPRASGMEEVTASDIRENEGLFITPEGHMSVIGETSPYVEGMYTGPQPPRDITRELKGVPRKIVLMGKPLAKKTIQDVEGLAKQGAKHVGKLVLKSLKEAWSGRSEAGSSAPGLHSKQQYERMMERVEDQYLRNDISGYEYYAKAKAIASQARRHGFNVPVTTAEE